MDDILASIRGHINERLNSPLFGAYALAWLFFNYKVPLLIFSSLDVHQKIFQIDFYLHENFGQVCYVYGWPLVIAAAYIFVLPIPSYAVTAFNLSYQNRLAKMQQEKLNKRVVLEEDLLERVSKWQSSIETKDRRIEELDSQNESLRNMRKRAETERDEIAIELRKSEEARSKIPELQAKIDEANGQVKSQAAEIIDLKQKIRGLVSETERTSEILRNFALDAIPESAVNVINKQLAALASDSEPMPAPIEVLTATLGLRQVSPPASRLLPNQLRAVGPDGALYRVRYASGIAGKDLITHAQLYDFLNRFCSWVGVKKAIDEVEIIKLAEVMDTVVEELANPLYSYISTKTEQFKDMPESLKRILLKIVGVNK